MCSMVDAFWELLARAPQLSSVDVKAYRRKPTFDILDEHDISFAVPRIECNAVPGSMADVAEAKHDDDDDGGEMPASPAETEEAERQVAPPPPPPPSPPRTVKKEGASTGLKLTLSKSLLKVVLRAFVGVCVLRC